MQNEYDITELELLLYYHNNGLFVLSASYAVLIIKWS